MNGVPDELVGRVAVVTGATSGIGYEIATGLARLGGTVVVAGRGAERAAAAAESIGRTALSRHVESLESGDLSVRGEQHALADELLRRYPKIHVLVNNAGAIFARRERTQDGLERTFALNVLAPFVLTDRLAGRLRESGAGRVVNIASAAHRRQHVELSDLQTERSYSAWRAYGRSKLELILLTREFARRFGADGPTVNSVHPGFVRSGFAQNNSGAFAALVKVAGWIGGRSLVRGADTAVFVASDPSLAGVSGGYFSGRRLRPGSGASRDPTVAKELFERCASLASVRTPPTAP
ncbi:MAG TPA: SDR family NAD(P)-dependent oxidoreductase [Thermoplasmata archaeon]|nr:SDR family NAD(P)-dependent oxidoreductase [Thermoplasmata archaeon]